MLQFFTGKKNVNFFQNSQSTVFEKNWQQSCEKIGIQTILNPAQNKKIENDASAPQNKFKQKLFTKQK